MKYLVDANVLSELTKSTPDPREVAWLGAQERDIAVDPVIPGELRFGILILPKARKRSALERWFDEWSPLSTLGRGHGPEMGGVAGPSSDNRESYAD